MALITINGVPITDVISYSATPHAMDSKNTARSESMYLHREVIRRGVMDIALVCMMSEAQKNAIAAEATQDSFTLVYKHPEHSGTGTGTFYCGEPKYELVYFDESAPDNSLWRASYSFIEY